MQLGRPTVMTDEVLAKLEQAFAIDSTVVEALSYADIKPDAYYDYLKKHPEFSDRIEQLRQRPMLKARQSIVKGLDVPEFALKYAERKAAKEFATKQNVDIMSDGKALPTIIQIIRPEPLTLKENDDHAPTTQDKLD